MKSLQGHHDSLLEEEDEQQSSEVCSLINLKISVHNITEMHTYPCDVEPMIKMWKDDSQIDFDFFEYVAINIKKFFCQVHKVVSKSFPTIASVLQAITSFLYHDEVDNVKEWQEAYGKITRKPTSLGLIKFRHAKSFDFGNKVMGIYAWTLEKDIYWEDYQFECRVFVIY